jgi:apolipoprotein D and lipocalin family protein
MMRVIRLTAATLVCGFLLAGVAAMAQPAAREPMKAVDLDRYLGTWYEQGRYEQWFQRGCERVVVNYSRQADGKIHVVNSCRQGSVDGPVQTAEATARAVEGSNNAKLKVSFFLPFEGDYWVLDHAPDYSWSIVGEGSGRYLWILTRARVISERRYKELAARAAQFGYDVGQLRRTAQ